MGVEWPQPVINDQSRNLGFTNEIGYGDTVRLLKNIVGLWLIQESRRHWNKTGKKLEFADLEKLAVAVSAVAGIPAEHLAHAVFQAVFPRRLAEFQQRGLDHRGHAASVNLVLRK